MPDLRVEIPDEPTPVIVHRFRNFGEMSTEHSENLTRSALLRLTHQPHSNVGRHGPYEHSYRLFALHARSEHLPCGRRSCAHWRSAVAPRRLCCTYGRSARCALWGAGTPRLWGGHSCSWRLGGKGWQS